jgi:hypothetical protein
VVEVAANPRGRAQLRRPLDARLEVGGAARLRDVVLADRLEPLERARVFSVTSTSAVRAMRSVTSTRTVSPAFTSTPRTAVAKLGARKSSS